MIPGQTREHRRASNSISTVGLLVILLFVGCSQRGRADSEPPRDGTREPAADATVDSTQSNEAVVGQAVYVPVYSHIYFQDEHRVFDLAATLSIRNTDVDHPIRITDIRYHDSNGQLVRKYGEGGVILQPLSSRAFVVEERDRTGGVGANFIVEWEATVPVSLPLIEAVMISTASTQGISFVSRGRAIRSMGATGADTTGTP